MARATKRRRSAADWETMVHRWQGSNLTLSDFAERERINPDRLVWWERRLRLSRPKASQPRLSRSRQPEQTRFIQLVPALERAAASGCPFELVVGRGRAIRVPVGFDEASLVRLVGVLEADRA